jgi:hypothetical protein
MRLAMSSSSAKSKMLSRALALLLLVFDALLVPSAAAVRLARVSEDGGALGCNPAPLVPIGTSSREGTLDMEIDRLELPTTKLSWPGLLTASLFLRPALPVLRDCSSCRTRRSRAIFSDDIAIRAPRDSFLSSPATTRSC